MEKPYINRGCINFYSNPDYTTKDQMEDFSISTRMICSIVSMISIIIDPVVFLLGCVYEAIIALIFIWPLRRKLKFIWYVFTEFMPNRARTSFYANLDIVLLGRSEKIYNKARDAVAQHYHDQIELINM